MLKIYNVRKKVRKETMQFNFRLIFGTINAFSKPGFGSLYKLESTGCEVLQDDVKDVRPNIVCSLPSETVNALMLEIHTVQWHHL